MISRGQLRAYRWQDVGDAPLIPHPPLSPVIADPAVVAPEQSPDGLWHLFAHSSWGIHAYSSTDGRAWRDRGIAVWHAMRPWIFQESGSWSLLYEKYPAFGLTLTIMPGRTWRSWIEMRVSRDLKRWQSPRILLEPTLPWHTRPGSGDAVGNPCLVRVNGRYRLYYSASLVRVPDCGFNEPACIGIAESDMVEGPYSPHQRPLLKAEPGDPHMNLSPGCIRVIALEDGWAGFQNGISLASGVSRSSILLLTSKDGLLWERASPTPIVSPGAGWKRSHVYAACPVVRAGGEILLYYNARSDWKLQSGRESIGLACGRPAEERV
jgi:hypothetical protein